MSMASTTASGRARRGAALSLLAGAALLSVGAAEGTADPTPPVIVPHVSETLGLNGWHVRDTTVSWTYYDPESGISQSNGCDTRTVREETTGLTFTCRATNGEGLVGSYSVTIKLDEKPPTVRPRPTRPADRRSWFNHTVSFTVAATDPFSGIGTCSQVPSYSGPDRTNVRVRARCRDRAGHWGSGSRVFDYDDTSPSVHASFARDPDRYGWYARDIRVTFSGTDATSRMAACATRVYRGPNRVRASVTGWCKDRAGNVGYRTRRFKFWEPLVEPGGGRRVSSPPLLDWVPVQRALEYNAQVWQDGRKILSKWPDRSRLQLERGWRFDDRWHQLRPGRRYTVYVWPRFRQGYGRLLGKGAFTFVRG